VSQFVVPEVVEQDQSDPEDVGPNHPEKILVEIVRVAVEVLDRDLICLPGEDYNHRAEDDGAEASGQVGQRVVEDQSLGEGGTEALADGHLLAVEMDLDQDENVEQD